MRLAARWPRARPGGWYNPSSGPLAQLVEQGTFNPKVTGSKPVRPTTNHIRPHRLAAKDSALSRRQQGFEFPWGHHILAGQRPSRVHLGPEIGLQLRPLPRRALVQTRSSEGVSMPSGGQEAVPVAGIANIYAIDTNGIAIILAWQWNDIAREVAHGYASRGQEGAGSTRSTTCSARAAFTLCASAARLGSRDQGCARHDGGRPRCPHGNHRPGDPFA